jgi:HNH endonuclease
MDASILDALADRVLVGDGCWEWTGGGTKNGYGTLKLSGATKLAHRTTYELFVGPVPVGLELDHLCRNRRCVRPDHLEPVTRTENILRGEGPQVARDRHAAKTHCPQGHEYTSENTRTYPGGVDRKYLCRSCVQCDRVRSRDAQRRRRAAL